MPALPDWCYGLRPGFVDDIERGLGDAAEAAEAGVGRQAPDRFLACLRAEGVAAVLG
jgi:hypothetical protein